ncbi:FtsQ-type POTRA domain-containing protein [Streptomyces sp. R302]|uniref:FtsQ-type POTRA domain-containing protein n=1 Tax=unclassified Streptomyces TaxID=2593676 RepID=UPI00145E4AF1|nr:FtsQ-type POTRA domain-containing protein [Streptomyces sp. R301]NML77949.1 FtsQ-type POTRA domain-containing protein [Streptomyces sp. R302]
MAAGPTTAEKSGTSKPKGSSDRQPRPEGTGGRFRPTGLKLALAAVGLLLLAGGTVWALYGSTWFRVEGVKTSGTAVLTRAQVEAVAAVPVGAPLATVDTDAIAARLREELPRIASVDVIRSWPHGIRIEVTERKPVLLLEKRGSFTEVDGDAVPFATVTTPPRGVPRLVLDVAASPSLRRFDADRLLAEAVRVRSELPDAIAKNTRVVRLSSYDSVTLELTRGRTVLWGSAEHGPAKARVLAALMKATPKAGHFDVSAPSAPASSGS